MKVVLKGCPRCSGDLVPDRYSDGGRDMVCVQCGYEAPFVLVSHAAPMLVAKQPVAAAPMPVMAGSSLKVA